MTSERTTPEVPDISRFSRSLLIVYLFEAGAVLLVAPWTRYWHRNYFVEMWPFLDAALTSAVARGAISGIGIVSLGAGSLEAWTLLHRWYRARGHHGKSYRRLEARDLREEA